MLDLQTLQGIRLHGKPAMHRIIGVTFLGPSYNLPLRTKIVVEGRENLPTEPVILAMNHTDRYNYWPFQYWLWRKRLPFTATWVKGKYYEKKWLAKFMELTNNIPTPSRGYVMTRDFIGAVGRPPKDEEYAALRELAKGHLPAEGVLPEEILTQERNMLGRVFHPENESYGECLDAIFGQMWERFVELNQEAFDKGLNLLVFPQGTRSIRLSKGHLGFVQAALRFKRAIVPIGCNGSDKVYPGGNPWARAGKITYRIGKPIPYSKVSEYALPEGVDPFALELEQEHKDKMQKLVDLVMDAINELLDPPYQYGGDDDSDGVTGSRRFV